MAIDEQIPEMTDAQLSAIHANASRLSESGTKQQQAEAGRLLPIIDAERVRRAESKTAALAERRAQRREADAAARREKRPSRAKKAAEA